MVSIHRGDAEADQHKTCSFDSSEYSLKIVPTFGAWTRFFLSESYGVYRKSYLTFNQWLSSLRDIVELYRSQ